MRCAIIHGMDHKTSLLADIRSALDTLDLADWGHLHGAIIHQHPTLWSILTDEASRVRRGDCSPSRGRISACRRAVAMLGRVMVEQYEDAADHAVAVSWGPMVDRCGRSPAHMTPENAVNYIGIIDAGESTITVGMEGKFSFTTNDAPYRVWVQDSRSLETMYVDSRPGDLRRAIGCAVDRATRHRQHTA